MNHRMQLARRDNLGFYRHKSDYLVLEEFYYFIR